MNELFNCLYELLHCETNSADCAVARSRGVRGVASVGWPTATVDMQPLKPE